jgi:hypothetical protein
METAVCCIRESFIGESCVLEREGKRQLCERTCRVRTCVIELLTVFNSCVLKRKQIGRVLAGCVICELCSRTGRSCTCARILEEL